MLQEQSESLRKHEKVADLMMVPRSTQSLQNGTRFTTKAGAYEASQRKGGLCATMREVRRKPQPFFQKVKGKSNQSKSKVCEIGESQGR